MKNLPGHIVEQLFVFLPRHFSLDQLHIWLAPAYPNLLLVHAQFREHDEVFELDIDYENQFQNDCFEWILTNRYKIFWYSCCFCRFSSFAWRFFSLSSFACSMIISFSSFVSMFCLASRSAEKKIFFYGMYVSYGPYNFTSNCKNCLPFGTIDRGWSKHQINSEIDQTGSSLLRIYFERNTLQAKKEYLFNVAPV